MIGMIVTTATLMQQITWVDGLILGAIGLSTMVGLWRGFIREAFSLITWATAIFLGLVYCTKLSQYFFLQIQIPALRILVCFVLIFFSILISGTLISKVFVTFVQRVGFGSLDRVIGLVFGSVRGVLIVGLLITAANTLHLNRAVAWHQSLLVPKFASMIEWVHHSILPLVGGAVQPA